MTPSQLEWWNELLGKVINVKNGGEKPQKCKRCDYRTLTRYELFPVIMTFNIYIDLGTIYFQHYFSQQRKLLHNAIQMSMKTKIDGVSRYHLFVRMHNQKGAHRGPAFLPWHRIYLILYVISLFY